MTTIRLNHQIHYQYRAKVPDTEIEVFAHREGENVAIGVQHPNLPIAAARLGSYGETKTVAQVLGQILKEWDEELAARRSRDEEDVN